MEKVFPACVFLTYNFFFPCFFLPVALNPGHDCNTILFTGLIVRSGKKEPSFSKAWLGSGGPLVLSAPTGWHLCRCAGVLAVPSSILLLIRVADVRALPAAGPAFSGSLATLTSRADLASCSAEVCAVESLSERWSLSLTLTFSRLVPLCSRGSE